MVLGESCQVQNDVCNPSYTNENKHLCLCAGECAQDFIWAQGKTEHIKQDWYVVGGSWGVSAF